MLLDTYAWAEYFKGTQKGRLVKELVKEETCFTCAVSLAELAEWCLREKVSLQGCLKTVKALSIIINLSEEMLELAGRLNYKQKKKIKNWGMVDSIILSAAKTHNLRIVTGDKHFAKIEGAIML